jgi:hypothetical protein
MTLSPLHLPESLAPVTDDGKYYHMYLQERHRVMTLQEELKVVSSQRDALEDTLSATMDELNSASETLSHVTFLTNECEQLQKHNEQLKDILEKLAETSFSIATTARDRAAIMTICQDVLECGTSGMISVERMLGLPRLRVFDDELCEIELVVLDSHNDMLWKSNLIEVLQSEISNFQLHCIKIPSELFAEDSKETRIAVMFDGSVIAETDLISLEAFTSDTRLRLFHNGIQLEGGEIVLKQ